MCRCTDNDVNLKVLVRLLVNMKCDVTTAGDGAECIAKIDALLPHEGYPYFDLIFMDLVCPVDLMTAGRNSDVCLAGRRCRSWMVVGGFRPLCGTNMSLSVPQ